LARDGLRTLCICQKAVTEKEYQGWKIKYVEAQNAMENRAEKARDVID